MKKTLIALMALAGVAAAADEQYTIQAEFTTPPTRKGEFYADNYVFTFTLAEEFTIAESGAILGAYWGSQKDSNNNDPGLSANAIYLTEVDGNLTLNLGDGKLSSILGNEGSLTNEITFTSQRGMTFENVTIQKGVTYTLSVTVREEPNPWNGYYGMMTPTLTWEGGSAVGAEYNGGMNGNTDTLNYGVNPGVAIVPEPTTATLSLLALAGLAARRRRHECDCVQLAQTHLQKRISLATGRCLFDFGSLMLDVGSRRFGIPHFNIKPRYFYSG